MDIRIEYTREWTCFVMCQNAGLCKDIVLRTLDQDSIDTKELLLILNCPDCYRYKSV
jgi:hypothetical protein